ncbi:hypothetical protein ABE67_14970 [Cytobacillus firmus]|nr:hypothetical protein [Cytobacillus firmus]
MTGSVLISVPLLLRQCSLTAPLPSKFAIYVQIYVMPAEMSAKNTITIIASAALKHALSVQKNAVKWLLKSADKTDIQQGVCFKSSLFAIFGYGDCTYFPSEKAVLN